jgi:hypothetical protein
LLVVHVPVQYSDGSVSRVGGRPADEGVLACESSVRELGDPAGPVSTVTVELAEEVTDSGSEALSVTLSSKR